MKPHQEHRKRAKSSMLVHIVTVSTSRYEQFEKGGNPSDESGDAAASEMKRQGHTVTSRGLVSDDADMVRAKIQGFLSSGDDVLLLIGGTGVSRRDITIETALPFFERELEGFGEALRRLSYDEIGGAAMLTRATLGLSGGKLIACLPGSPGAVRTALTKLSPEFPHALFIARS